jgi:hypothetical protein
MVRLPSLPILPGCATLGLPTRWRAEHSSRQAVRDDRDLGLRSILRDHDEELKRGELDVETDLLQVRLDLLRATSLVRDANWRGSGEVLQWKLEAARKASLRQQFFGELHVKFRVEPVGVGLGLQT